MSLYKYSAYNADGAVVTGSLEAASVAAVEVRLRAGGAWLLDARESGPAAAARPRARAGRRTGIRRRDLIGLFVEMTLLLRARITLPQALRRLAEDFEAQRLGCVLAEIRDDVTAGVPLHQAMERRTGVFPPEVVAMVQAGEAAGKLPDAFENLTSYYQWLDQVMADVRQALIYPCMVIGATAVLIAGLFTFIVPRFVDLLNGMTLRVPLITRIVMAISAGLVRSWPIILGTGLAFSLLLKGIARSPRCARAIDRALMTRLPVFGPLIAMFALSRFAHNLGMLYRSGIPLLRGLEICRSLVGSEAMAHALDDVRRGVAEGMPLSRCLARHDLFPPSMVTMVAAGEASGMLDSSLQSIANYYNLTIPRRIKIIFSVFDPLMMLALIALVGFVALAVVLPILQLWQLK
jgi:type II secretory pathway component PulF